LRFESLMPSAKRHFNRLNLPPGSDEQ